MKSSDADMPELDGSGCKPGDRLGGYVLTRVIGRGGMGEVWEARDAALNVLRAVKVFSVPPCRLQETLRRKFIAETRIMAGFVNPHIVRVFGGGSGPSDGPLHYAMELVALPEALAAAARRDPSALLAPSPAANTAHAAPRAPSPAAAPPPAAPLEPVTLANLIAAERPVPPALAARFYADLRDALAFCHSRGVVHSDVKAENVLISPSGHAMLADFGIARIIDPDARRALTLATLTLPSGAGTAWYVAPECRNGAKASPAADVYAFGVLMFKLLTGIWYEGSARLLSQIPDLAPAQAPLLRKMLAADPKKRFSSANDLPPELPQRPIRRRRLAAMTLSALAAIAIAGAIFALALPIHSEKLPPETTEAATNALASAAGAEASATNGLMSATNGLDSATNAAANGEYDGIAWEPLDALTCGPVSVPENATRSVLFTNASEVALPSLAPADGARLIVRRPESSRCYLGPRSQDSTGIVEFHGDALFHRKANTKFWGGLRLSNHAYLWMDGANEDTYQGEIEIGEYAVLHVRLIGNGHLWKAISQVRIKPRGLLLLDGGPRIYAGRTERWTLEDRAEMDATGLTRLTPGSAGKPALAFIPDGHEIALVSGSAEIFFGSVFLWTHGWRIDVGTNATLNISLRSLACYDYWTTGDFTKTGPGTLAIALGPNASGSSIAGSFPVAVNEGALRLKCDWKQDADLYSQKGKQFGDWSIAQGATLEGDATLALCPGRTAHVRGALAGNLHVTNATLHPGAILRPERCIALDAIALAGGGDGAARPIRLVQARPEPGALLTWKSAPEGFAKQLDAQMLPGFHAKISASGIEAIRE